MLAVAVLRERSRLAARGSPPGGHHLLEPGYLASKLFGVSDEGLVAGLAAL
ncbi:MAG: hypothetical protein ACRDJF_12385 [Actinomycetota bacterium]